MSTVAPSNEPVPISSRSVALHRSGAMCQAALRTRDGSICSRVCARASSMRCCIPAGASSEARSPIPTGTAICRTSGSRHRLSSIGGRSFASRESSLVPSQRDRVGAAFPLSVSACPCDGDVMALRGGRSGRSSSENDGWGGFPRRWRDARAIASPAGWGTGAWDLRRGFGITKGVRTATGMVAKKMTLGSES